MDVITSAMPYVALDVVMAKQHPSDAGIGTLMVIVLPYTIVFVLGWSLFLLGWMALELPLGAGRRDTAKR